MRWPGSVTTIIATVARAAGWPRRSAAVEADCPFCRERDVFPYKSDDRTVVIEEHQQLFVVLEAMKSASRHGDYRKLKSFPTRDKAEAFISGRLRRVN